MRQDAVSGEARKAIVAPLAFKPSRLNGLSRDLLVSHYENNYGGALRRLNAIESAVRGSHLEDAPNFVVNGLKREALIAANSVILHEVYFDNLGGAGDADGALAEALERDFGSVAAWRREFVAMAKAQAGRSGWALLSWSPRFGTLTNQWAADHAHCLAGAAPVLALDMYEHAYHIDFGAKAGAYVDAFMANVHWQRAGARYLAAVEGSAGTARTTGADTVTVEELRADLDERRDVTVLDVRLSDDFAWGGDMIPTSRHRDPERLEEWIADLPRQAPVVAYCAYGFEVSRDAVAALRRAGFDARTLEGGIAAWHAIGGATAPKPA